MFSLNGSVLFLILAEFSKIKDEARVAIDEKKVEESKDSTGRGGESQKKEDEPKQQQNEELKSTSASPKPQATEVNLLLNIKNID